MRFPRRSFPLLLLLSASMAAAQFGTDEIALYSSSGKPVAYIADDDDATIYLWSGTPVAYLHGDNIYGYNGKHLGWFKSGVVYDHQGDAVGVIKSRFRGAVEITPIKSIKEIKPIKGIREIPPIKPIFGNSWSEDTSLKLFLLEGRD